MKKTRILALVLAIAVFALGGCRFAREVGSAENGDRLVGVSLQPEIWGEPDGFDEDGNPFWSMEPDDGGTELTDEQAAALLRGENVALEAPAGEIGPYAVYLHEETDENGASGTGVRIDGWPGDVSTHISVTDEGTEYRLEAAAYVCDERLYGENTYNSVGFAGIYRRPDGSLYAEWASGIGGTVGDYSITLSEERAVRDGKESKTDRVEIVASLKGVDRLVSARVLAFDEGHALLAAQPLDLAADEQAYAAPEGAVYLLLEQTLVDADGEQKTTRTCADLPVAEDLPAFTVYIPMEDGLARPVEIAVR